MQQLQPNSLLQGGKYRIQNAAEVLPKHENVELGQGGFGITYLAEHIALGKRVCIKEFFMKELNLRSEDGSITGLSEGTLSYNYAQKFRKEAMNLAGMEHPNIVRVTDSFDENGTFYYVMDYIEGQNLNEYIKDHALSESEAISIIKDVANALMYMHEQKHMLHLDLKPGNIMRRASDGHIFLIDFGLSKHYDKSGTPETSTTIGGGTPGYAPTEQGDKAKDGEFRPTIDVYALGATLFKLLTRETPPTASEVVNDDEILAGKLSTRGVSQNVISLVVNSMKPGYKKRIQTMRDFIAALPSSTESFKSGRNYHTSPVNSEETIVTNSSNTPPNAKGFRENIHGNTTPQDKDKQEKDAEKSEDEIIGDPEEFIINSLPKVKFGFWLKLFLFGICAGGIVYMLLPLVVPSNSEVVTVGRIVLGVMRCILAFYTLQAFRSRKPDAVFLAKLCLIIPCLFDIILWVTGESGTAGMEGLQEVVKGTVAYIIWFVYLCVSKRVEAVIPSSYRKMLKRDYIICAAFAIFTVYFFAASQIETEVTTSQVANEVFEYNGEPVTYSGEVRDSLPNGYGTAQYPRGRYEGTFVNGARHGKGTFTDTDGGVFTGTFANNDFDQGKYVQKDGTYYEGTFQDQQPYNGTWYEKDGTVIVNVVNGK